ncbi:SUKH-4 family immunity protein [Streptomyces sp. SCSIO 30461]|uniref:SUKH-4 family immunity protein n=1 Tax=Streptomyces sp. SCSIO 30461 TaxID=3118085 RepID=UPI0030D1CF9F
MPETPPSPEYLSPEQSLSYVLDWWGGGGPSGGRDLHVVSHCGGPALMEHVHQSVTASGILDAKGMYGDEAFRHMLRLVGVPDSDLTSYGWHRAARRNAVNKLVLIKNAWQAGLTRRSAQPAIIRNFAARQLALEGAGVVVDLGPVDDEQAGPRRRGATLRLDDSALLEGRLTSAMSSPYIQVLALSEPRHVPLEVWGQLARGAGLPDRDGKSLNGIALRYADLLTVDDDHVAFLDEAVPEALRHRASADFKVRVNRHMARWLREAAPRLRHPDGWAASGALGWYAAHGLAMHAVQADEFEGLLTDGEAVANLPRAVLVDAAHCAYDGSLPGSNPAADAVFLQMYGVNPPSQGEWAAWLHLMAMSRDDTELRQGIENSGVRLPWKTRWTHWRPPGGYDVSYLKPGPVHEVHAVRWQGRPAVAACTADRSVLIWDLATSELVAGPWSEEQFPRDQLHHLSWDTEIRTHDTQDTPQAFGPTTRTELSAHGQCAEGPVEDDDFLSISLDMGTVTVVAGLGGVFAVESTKPGEPAVITHFSDNASLLGNNTAAGPARPSRAQLEPSALCASLPDVRLRRTDTERIPAGLTDQVARRILVDTGLPALEAKGIRLHPERPEFLCERQWPSDVEQAQESGPFYEIGLWMGGEVVVDGSSGHVFRIPSEPDESGLEGALVAADLDRFLKMLIEWLTGRFILEDLDNRDEAFLLRQHIEDAIWLIDDTGSAAGAWQYPLHNE